MISIGAGVGEFGTEFRAHYRDDPSHHDIFLIEPQKNFRSLAASFFVVKVFMLIRFSSSGKDRKRGRKFSASAISETRRSEFAILLCFVWWNSKSWLGLHA